MALTKGQIENALMELAAKQIPPSEDGRPIRITYNGTEWVGLPAGAFVKFQVSS